MHTPANLWSSVPPRGKRSHQSGEQEQRAAAVCKISRETTEGWAVWGCKISREAMEGWAAAAGLLGFSRRKPLPLYSYLLKISVFQML